MPGSFKRKVAIGVAWMTAARAAARALGLVSTVVLARLLTPADFGLVAMATVVAAAIELLTLFGFDAALVQRREISRAHYDTAWTLNILLGSGLAVALIAAAMPAANFYREPRLEMIMYIIAVKYFILNAANTGIVDFRRNINFRPEFILQVAPKLVGVLATIPLAFWLRDYRALLAGMLISAGVTFVLSYVMHPHRPRWCLSAARTLYDFSRWLLLNNLVTFLRNRSADLIIGRALGPASLGIYSIAYEVSNLPSTDMVAPINRVLFPSYARLNDDFARLRDAFRASLGLIALIILPASVGLGAVADPLVRVMLGEKWLAAIQIVPLLAIAGASTVLQSNTGSLHGALGQPRMVAMSGAIQVALLLPMLVYATFRFGLQGAAWAVLVHSVALALPVTYFIVCRTTPVRFIDIVKASWRPVAGCAVMYGTVRAFLATSGAGPNLFESLVALLAACALGALVYPVVVLLLWLVSGKPPGAESLLLDRIKPLWNRFGIDGRRPD
jgi:O-antigen/teichoic acid export membrane protein